MRSDELRDAYLDRLGDALHLPPGEGAEAIEEIAGHLEAAVEDSVRRGTPPDVAIEQALARLGAPDRLARDLTAAHRRPKHVLEAAGAAVRITVVTGLGALIGAWLLVVVGAVLVAVVGQAVERLAGVTAVTDWTPMVDGLLPGLVGAIVAFVVGRALVVPVAARARRDPDEVRLPIATVGIAVAVWMALTGVEAQWNPWTALIMASMPAWFGFGVWTARPGTSPLDRMHGWLAPALLVAVAGSVGGLAIAGLGSGAARTETFEDVGTVFDPSEQYAAIGPFANVDHPPVELHLGDGTFGPELSGPGPVTVTRRGTITTSDAGAYDALRLEIWPAPPGGFNGPMLDPRATEPVASAPMTRDGRSVRGSLTFWPLTDRQGYYVAVTARDAAGDRVQLAWPDAAMWTWRGTVLDWVTALGR
jgi:uncharacterized membrane protein